MKYVKGETVQEQIESIDRTLVHFSRRLHKTVVGVIPPDLTFNYVDKPDENGVILRSIFPEGKLLKGFMFVEEYAERKPVKFIVDIQGLSGGKRKEFLTRKQLQIIDPYLDVNLGDRLTFSCAEPEMVRGIWVGFLFQIFMKDSIKECIDIAEVEALMEGKDAEET